jgi:PAS domain S-box-containing protein
VILDSIADGVFTVDRDWRVRSFNRAAEVITGVTRSEAIGRRCWEVFRASICESACALKQTMESGRPVIDRRVYIVRADGRRVPISVSTALLKDGSGEIVGGVETFRDLSVEEELRRELRNTYSFEEMISKSAAMQRIFDLLPDVAESGSTVLIRGESGTGKELLARAIHNLSPRKDGPLVVVNCGALPDTLLETELFGHRAGAFTGAVRDRAGRFAVASGGSIFLDEIGDVSPALQSRLLRVLQDGTFERLGSTRTERADVRVIAATNRDLEAAVEEGTFRGDLYYRLNVIGLELPPLRERRQDIPLLVDHFIERFSRLRSKEIRGIGDDALEALMNYDYPGNIRELENAIEHAFVMCRRGTIHARHLPERLRPGPDPAAEAESLEELEKRFLLDLLERHAWNRAATARALGVHKTTLWRRMKRLRIKPPER